MTKTVFQGSQTVKAAAEVAKGGFSFGNGGNLSLAVDSAKGEGLEQVTTVEAFSHEADAARGGAQQAQHQGQRNEQRHNGGNNHNRDRGGRPNNGPQQGGGQAKAESGPNR